ncbi:hypothetical protein N8T08_006169 [Aspergillus melleus]|uniref:Uncharacterized protein n=1 Tax=Aspergillus melleus TaxID=138277 RepID=A0ACC3B0E8_9EURO|nr:hypothetical protein N8T08_006169 [Aspergillus melleus]
MAPPRDWFAQLEKKLTKVVRDRRQKRQIKQLLEAAKEDRKRQNDEKSYPTVRVTAIKPKRVEELFKINKATFKGPAPWGISPDDSVEVPLSLIESLERKHRLFRKADENEALVRTKIDAVLKTAWGIKQHTNVQIQLERKLKVNLPIDKPNVTIVGTADYAIWYGEEVDDESTCVCVIEAKAPGKDGRFQALSYMSRTLINIYFDT